MLETKLQCTVYLGNTLLGLLSGPRSSTTGTVGTFILVQYLSILDYKAQQPHNQSVRIRKNSRNSVYNCLSHPSSLPALNFITRISETQAPWLPCLSLAPLPLQPSLMPLKKKITHLPSIKYLFKKISTVHTSVKVQTKSQVFKVSLSMGVNFTS